MPDGFNLPLTYLLLFFIPAVFITLALIVRSSLERVIKGNIGRALFWSVASGILGLLTWYILMPFYANQSLHIYFYGILITVGVIAAAFLATAEAKRRGMDTEIIWDVLFWVVLAGIVGARLWHVLLPSKSAEFTTSYYLTHPLDMFNLRKGGLGIPGAVIGGALALWIYCRNKKISFLAWADVAAPGVALAQAIGRWGNYFNQELYGPVTKLPWGIPITNLNQRVDPYRDLQTYPLATTLFHPLFLYESLWNLVNMSVLLWLARRFSKWLKPGDIFLFYILFYAIGRFGLEFLRIDIATVGGVNANQWFMVVVVVVSAGVLIWRHKFARV